MDIKPQDILFLILLVGLLLFQKPRWFTYTGLAFLIFALPLFTFHIFFTAQRFVWYATTFLLIAVILLLFRFRNK